MDLGNNLENDMDLGNNSIPKSNDLVQQSREVSDIRVFHCCVCSEPLNLGPIFQCTPGHHHTCSKCHNEGEKKCFVCSLPVTQCSLPLKVNLESLNVPCPIKAPENASIFSPCPCPLEGCNFHSDYKYFAFHFNKTHLLPIRPFMYGMMYGTVISVDEEAIILTELNDGVVFALKNRVEKMGNNITLYHFTPDTLNKEFSVDLTAITPSGESYYLLDAKVQNIQQSTSVGPSAFLLIPFDFSQSPGWLTLEICISKIGVA